jgi:hypothetical protein
MLREGRLFYARDGELMERPAVAGGQKRRIKQPWEPR